MQRAITFVFRYSEIKSLAVYSTGKSFLVATSRTDPEEEEFPCLHDVDAELSNRGVSCINLYSEGALG
jgi:hypothetical protein